MKYILGGGDPCFQSGPGKHEPRPTHPDTLTPSNLEDLDHLFRDAYLPRKGQNHILSLYYIGSMQYHSSVRMCVFMYSSA